MLGHKYQGGGQAMRHTKTLLQRVFCLTVLFILLQGMAYAENYWEKPEWPFGLLQGASHFILDEKPAGCELLVMHADSSPLPARGLLVKSPEDIEGLISHLSHLKPIPIRKLAEGLTEQEFNKLAKSLMTPRNIEFAFAFSSGETCQLQEKIPFAKEGEKWTLFPHLYVDADRAYIFTHVGYLPFETEPNVYPYLKELMSRREPGDGNEWYVCDMEEENFESFTCVKQTPPTERFSGAVKPD